MSKEIILINTSHFRGQVALFSLLYSGSPTSLIKLDKNTSQIKYAEIESFDEQFKHYFKDSYDEADEIIDFSYDALLSNFIKILVLYREKEEDKIMLYKMKLLKSCFKLQKMTESSSLSIEMKKVILLPCLFTLKSFFSFHKCQFLKDFFESYIQEKMAQDAIELIQAFKQTYIRNEISSEDLEVMNEMYINSLNAWE